MLPTTIAAWVLSVATLVAIGAILIALIQVLALRLEDRTRPPRLAQVIAGAGGFVFGLGLLLSETVPQARIPLVVVAVILVLGGLFAGRPGPVGLFLVGVSIAWLVLGTALLLDQAWFGIQADLERVVPSMTVAAIALFIGVVLFENRRRLRSRFEHDVAETRPLAAGEERRWNAASLAIADRQWWAFSPSDIASTVALVVGAVLTVVVAHGQPIIVAVAISAVGIIGSSTAAALAVTYARTNRSRRALEAFAWLGEWELARIAAMNGGRVMTTRPAFRRYVRMVPERPDDRWFRAEVLAVTGKLDEAREMAQRMPQDSPYERVERAACLAYIDWLAGGSGDPTALQAAVDALLPGDVDERLRAEVVAAIHEVRVRAGAAEPDPAAPLRAVRGRLGSRADGVMLVYARRVMRSFTPLVVLVVGGAAALDHLSVLP